MKQESLRIRSDIPLPQDWEKRLRNDEQRQKMGAPKKYDVTPMEMGDSFLYEGSPHVANGHITFWNLKTGYTFLKRNTEEGIRIWRVA